MRIARNLVAQKLNKNEIKRIENNLRRLLKFTESA